MFGDGTSKEIYEKKYVIQIYNLGEVDVKVKCIEAGKTQAQLGEAVGTTGQYVNRIIKK